MNNMCADCDSNVMCLTKLTSAQCDTIHWQLAPYKLNVLTFHQQWSMSNCHC